MNLREPAERFSAVCCSTQLRLALRDIKVSANDEPRDVLFASRRDQET
jgi:hypothetical protein